MTMNWAAGEDADPDEVDWIMTATGRDRYDPFAETSSNYVTIDCDGETASANTFRLWTEGDVSTDTVVYVESDKVYGAGRKIDKLVFDIAHSASEFDRTVALDAAPGAQPASVGYEGTITLGVRPIRTKFTASAISYASAVALTKGTGVSIELFNIAETLGVDTEGRTDTAHATIEGNTDSHFGGMFAFKQATADGQVDVWNSSYATIYGWELSLSVGGEIDEAAWTGAVGNAATECYAIRK